MTHAQCEIPGDGVTRVAGAGECDGEYYKQWAKTVYFYKFHDIDLMLYSARYFIGLPVVEG